MSAGLPGVGLSGIFFIASALLMVPLEVVRTLRGQSSLARWSSVLGHFATAVAMIALLALCYVGLHVGAMWLASAWAHGSRSASGAPYQRVSGIPLLPLVVTVALVSCVLALAKLAELAARASRARAGLVRAPGDLRARTLRARTPRRR
jgi:hypothetical protein